MIPAACYHRVAQEEDLQVDLTRTLEQCTAAWNELAMVDQPTLSILHTQTLLPPRLVDTAERGVLRRTLPRLWGIDGELPQVDVKDKIAEGGMGVIRSAIQVPLQREVALKEVRPERRSEETLAELTREALLVGALDHPNIVPVYLLGEDAEGAPVVVMKRIHGRSWGSVLREPDDEWKSASKRDPLERHLEILMQVCNAVHFAHSRGILHRDLKPDNVMIGTFGEVYLLDWGIAVALPGAANGLESAAARKGVAGTPGYMAPEMTTGDNGTLSERSDVYLLGAILHEIVTGELRHVGDSLFQVLYSAYESKPFKYGADVPRELADIIGRATARDPADRFQSAEELRLALEDFIHHRESRRLSEDAMTSLERLQAAIDARESLDVYRLFGEVRFGFLAAQQIWDGNEQARDGLRDCLLAMVEFEVAGRDPKAARVLLAELSDPPAEVEERLRSLEEELAAEEADVAKLRAEAEDMDLAVGRQHRARLALYLAFDWTLAPLLVWGITREPVAGYIASISWIPAWARPQLTPNWLIAVLLPFLLFGTGYVVWQRDKYFVNRANRLLLYSLLICVGALGVMHAVSLLWSFDLDTFLIITLLVFGVVSASNSLFIERQMWWVTGGYVLALLGAAHFPEWNLWLLAAGNLFCFGFLRSLWSDDTCSMAP